MPANEMVLALRPDVQALPGSEGLSNHAVVQLGALSSNSSKAFTEKVTITHSASWLPQINLSLAPDPVPDWLTFLTITRVPHVLGSPISPMPPGPLPVPSPVPVPAVAVSPPVLPTPYAYSLAPVSDLIVPGISAAHVAMLGLNGIAYFSSPFTQHTLIISGQVRPGASLGVKKYTVRLMGGPIYIGPTTAPQPSKPIGKIDLAAVIIGS